MDFEARDFLGVRPFIPRPYGTISVSLLAISATTGERNSSNSCVDPDEQKETTSDLTDDQNKFEENREKSIKNTKLGSIQHDFCTNIAAFLMEFFIGTLMLLWHNHYDD